MKMLFKEAYRIYKKYPLRITLILFLDIAIASISTFNPYVIGACIDDLVDGRYNWLCILIILQVFLIAILTADRFFDTRLYNKIIEEEKTTYYEKIIQTNADESKISSLLDLVDDVPCFIEVNLFDILCMIGGIIFSLIFILYYVGTQIFIIAIIISSFVPLATYRLQKNIVQNNKEYKNNEENRVTYIASKSINHYKKYIKKALSLEIATSDLDAKTYLITGVLQTLLLVTAIYLTIVNGEYASGQLFSTFTYVMMLNNYVGEINENVFIINDLKDTVIRLERGIQNDL